jgi:MFS family permease
MSTLASTLRLVSPIPNGRATARGVAATFGATVAMATGFGSLVLPSVMAGPLAAEFGWSLADISLGYAIAAFGMAAGGIFWGRLTDRADLRMLLTLGSLFVVLPLWALSQVTALWQFHAAHAVLGFLGFGCLYPAVVCGAGAWFPRRRGLVMGIVTAGGAAGQGLMPYVADLLIAAQDWRQGYATLALCVAVAQIAVVAGVCRPDAPRAVAPGNSAESGRLGFFRRPRLVLLSVAAFCCCACMGVPLIHLAGHVSAVCGSPAAGATAMLAAMTSGAVGRVVFGLAADRIGNLKAYAVASAQQTLCIALFPLVQSEASILVLAMFFGFGFAGNMTCLLLCIRDEVPEGLYGAALGIVMFIAWLGMGVGGYLGGALADLTGTHTAGFWIAAVVGLANLALLLGLARPARTAAGRDPRTGTHPGLPHGNGPHPARA